MLGVMDSPNLSRVTRTNWSHLEHAMRAVARATALLRARRLRLEEELRRLNGERADAREDVE
jgi:hypothetical protein